MKQIVSRSYEISCQDIYCIGVNCKDCPLHKYALNHCDFADSPGYKIVTIPEEDMLEFIKDFNSMKFAINPPVTRKGV